MDFAILTGFAFGMFLGGLIWLTVITIFTRFHYSKNYSITFRSQTNFFVIIFKLIIAKDMNNPRIEYDEKLNFFIWQIRMALVLLIVGIISKFIIL